jgi:ATPase subunit of ABC transporter with duplicated ATPase domains
LNKALNKGDNNTSAPIKSITMLSMKNRSSYTGGPLVRKKSISNDDVISRFSSNVGLTELKHNSHKVTEYRAFIEGVTKSLKEIIERLNLHKSNAQLRNCVNVLDLFRRSKAIVFVGPICSGKTTTLKIVSNALHSAFKVRLRTSIVNTSTLTPEELYGSIDSFTEVEKKITDKSDEIGGEFSKSGIFKIILDVFEKERIANSKITEEKQRVIQSIFFDSCNIDQPLSESLLDFIDKTNKREVLNRSQTEFLLDFNLKGEIKAANSSGVDDRIPVTLPNGNVMQFPSDLFLFFETTSLRDASPPFVSKVGLIVTEEDDMTWQSIFKRQLLMFIRKH